MLFGIRYVKPSKNIDNQTKAVFKENIPGYEYTIFDTIGDELDKDPIILSSGKSYNYIEQGDYSTFYGCGGFLLPYPRNKDLAFKMNYLKEYNITELYIVNFYFTFMAINRNNKNLMLYTLVLDAFPSGEIISQSYSYIVSMFYQTSFDYFRSVLEIMFLIMSWWYIKTTLSNMILFVVSTFKHNVNKQHRYKKHSRVFLKYLGISQSIYKKKNWLLAWFKIIIALIMTLIRLVWYIILFVFSSINNIIDVASLITTLMITTKWIEIATEDLIEIDENGAAQNSIKYTNLLIKNLDEYKILYSILVFLLFLKAMKYFNFSYRLSIFSEVVKEASFDLMFFTWTIVILGYGYSLVGHLLFGLYDQNFRYIYYSLMTLFELLYRGNSFEDINVYNKNILYIYGVSFTWICILLINMFAAIILSHYYEYRWDQEEFDSNFFKIFLKNIIDKETPNQTSLEKGKIKQIVYFILKVIRDWVWSIKEEERFFRETAKCKQSYN